MLEVACLSCNLAPVGAHFKRIRASSASWRNHSLFACQQSNCGASRWQTVVSVTKMMSSQGASVRAPQMLFESKSKSLACRATAAAQHNVQPTWGTRRVILSFVSAESLSRFGGESPLPPQAANASRWAVSLITINLANTGGDNMKFRYLILSLRFLLAIICLGISSCNGPKVPTIDPNTSTVSPENVQVSKTDQYKNVPANTEDFPLPNCGGSSELAQTLGTQASVKKTITVGGTATVRGGSEIAISPVVKGKLEAEISIAYNETFQNENSRLDSIVLKAAPATHVVYVIQWVDEQFASTVSYILEGKAYDTDYVYTLRVPKLSNSYRIDCSTPNSSPSPTISPTLEPPTAILPASPIPSSFPTQSFGQWLITVGKYASVELAKSDAIKYTSQGYHVEIFCRVSEVTPGGPVEIRAAIVGFETEEAVNSEALGVWEINPYAQIKPLDLWCPNLTQSRGYISCNYNTCQ